VLAYGQDPSGKPNRHRAWLGFGFGETDNFVGHGDRLYLGRYLLYPEAVPTYGPPDAARAGAGGRRIVHRAVFVRLSDFPAGSPANGDLVTVKGVPDKVYDIDNDGHGGAELTLRKI